MATEKTPKEIVSWYFDQLIKQLEGLTVRCNVIEKDTKDIQITVSSVETDLVNIHTHIVDIKEDIVELDKNMDKLNECYHGLDKQLAIKIGTWSFLTSIGTVLVALVIAILTGFFDKHEEIRYVYPPGYINTRGEHNDLSDSTLNINNLKK